MPRGLFPEESGSMNAYPEIATFGYHHGSRR